MDIDVDATPRPLATPAELQALPLDSRHYLLLVELVLALHDAIYAGTDVGPRVMQAFTTARDFVIPGARNV